MTTKQYQEIMQAMKSRGTKKFNKMDVLNNIEAKKTGDWSTVHKSKFYIEHGGDYCRMQELLHRMFG